MNEALVRTIDPVQLARLAQAPAPPPVGVRQEDWEAMAPDDREAIIRTYLLEIEETVRDIKVELPKISIPTQGGKLWVLDEVLATPEFHAVIIHHSPARAWWQSEIVSNTRPDCASADGRHPDSGKGPTGAAICAECPKNAYGSSSKGRAKACKEMVKMFVAREGARFPYAFTVPPTSLKSFARYASSLIKAKPPRAFASLTTVFTLEQRQGSKALYSVVAFRRGDDLSYDKIRAAIAMRVQFQELMNERRITAGDVTAETAGDDDEPPARRDEERR